MQSDTSFFEFSSYSFEPKKALAVFTYRIQDPRIGSVEFNEHVEFPSSFSIQYPDESSSLFLQNLHLMLGISYWKTLCFKDIRIPYFALSRKQAEFWNMVYTKGLGEFFFRNAIDFRGLIQFPFSDTPAVSLHRKEMKNRSLVGLAGGKDSLLSVQMLKEHHIPFEGTIIETNHPYELVRTLGKSIGLHPLVIKRTVDPRLMELNARKDIYNGHIPISAIYAFLGITACYLADYRYFIASNEQSANSGNVMYQGTEINHQWSKSAEFENLFHDYVEEFISKDITYFSLLRPFTELKIVSLFARFGQYFSEFSSCNRNFRITNPLSGTKWCCSCPKCAFAFVMFAAFLPKKTVLGIFGENLLAKKELLTLYRQLLGLETIKPFDCVGTFEEVKAAFFLIDKRGEYKQDVICENLTQIVLVDGETYLPSVLETGSRDTIPSEFKSIISSYET